MARGYTGSRGREREGRRGGRRELWDVAKAKMLRGSSYG